MNRAAADESIKHDPISAGVAVETKNAGTDFC
jgi:hypothetical protein